MNLRYRVLFAEDGYEDKNLQKLVISANLGNKNPALWDYYGGAIDKAVFKEAGFNEQRYLKTLSRVADYNSLCNIADDASVHLRKGDMNGLETKIDLIYDMSDRFINTYADENHKLKKLTKGEIRKSIMDIAESNGSNSL